MQSVRHTDPPVYAREFEGRFPTIDVVRFLNMRHSVIAFYSVLLPCINVAQILAPAVCA